MSEIVHKDKLNFELLKNVCDAIWDVVMNNKESVGITYDETRVVMDALAILSIHRNRCFYIIQEAKTMVQWKQTSTSWPTHVWEPAPNAKAVIVELPDWCSWHIWIGDHLASVRSGCESVELAKTEILHEWRTTYATEQGGTG